MKQRTSLIYIKEKSSEQNLRHLGLKIIEWLGSMDMMHQLNKAVKMDKIAKTVLSSLEHTDALGRSYLFAMSIHLERRCLQMRAEREGIHRSHSLRISATFLPLIHWKNTHRGSLLGAIMHSEKTDMALEKFSLHRKKKHTLKDLWRINNYKEEIIYNNSQEPTYWNHGG